MTEKIEHSKYVDAIERTLLYVFEHGEIPNYTMINGKQVLKSDVYDACKRDNAFYIKEGHMPAYVNMLLQESAPTANPVKTDLLKRIEKAVGGEFKTAIQFYSLVKANDTYSHYSNDVYPQSQALTRLENKQGLNCADWSQIAYAALKELNNVYRKNYQVDYVHVACKSSTGAYNIGHIILRVKGEEFKEWTVFDIAEAASGGLPIGSTMCSLGYKVLSYNDPWLMSDDGET